MKTLRNGIRTFLKDKSRQKTRRRLAAFMAGAVIFSATSNLILPAAALDVEEAEEMAGVMLGEETLPQETATPEIQPETAAPEQAKVLVQEEAAVQTDAVQMDEQVDSAPETEEAAAETEEAEGEETAAEETTQ